MLSANRSALPLYLDGRVTSERDIMANLLQDVDGNVTFDQYAISDFWTGGLDADGRATLTASIETQVGLPYLLEFSMAANLAAEATDVAIQVSYAGQDIGTFDHSGALFAEQEILFTGTGSAADLVFTIVDNSEGGTENIVTDTVIPYYLKTVSVGARSLELKAFAPGQPYVYQVLSGQLVRFDIESSSYADADFDGPYKINAVGLNALDDLIYGIARANGTDATGLSVVSGDVVILDASGASYLVGHSGYSHFVGDFDEDGNLWTFPGSCSYAVRYDINNVDAQGNVQTTVFSLGTSIPDRGLADLAYDKGEGAFYGVTSGGNQRLVRIDISDVPAGGQADMTITEIDGTIVNGVFDGRTVNMTVGAAVVDASGNLYVGGNSGDHDLNPHTDHAGGFYRLQTLENGDLALELLSTAPAVGSNDGAMDPRVLDPFLGIDASSTVLLRTPVVSIAVAMDDDVLVTARGETTVNLLDNDNVNEGGSLAITHINGQDATAGLQITLTSGTQATYLGAGQMRFVGSDIVRDEAETFSYTIVNQDGLSDDGDIEVLTSPVDGTSDNDNLSGNGRADQQGNLIGGSDGASEVVLGYGGNDKLFTGDGDDALWGGDGHDNLRGAGGNDLLMGGAGNDLMSGGPGQDTVRGGTGNDAYWVEAAYEVVEEDANAGTDKVRSQVDWTLGANFENLFLEEVETAISGTGNELDNFISGNASANVLTGLGGKDRMVGRGGDDTLIGGAGEDDIDGNAGDDFIQGGAGRDKLRGGTGEDTIEGGADNDVYFINSLGDVAIEAVDGGHDLIKTSVDWTLGANFEDLVFKKAAADGSHATGNNGNNYIRGNDKDNLLEGLGGTDRLFGKSGDDSIFGGDGVDRLGGGAGTDLLDGGAGSDRLRSGTDDDRLIGGTGNDTIDGGSGADVFVFTVGDGIDRVYGFEIGTDLIEMNGLSFEDLTLSKRGFGCEVDYGADDTIWVAKLAGALLSETDFVFV
jgi:Ca2+-binding RTX toxin-like protein